MQFLKPIFMAFGLLFFGPQGALTSFGREPGRDFFELKIYHLQTREQTDRLDKYLQQAYLPALHRAGIRQVGVFKPLENPAGGLPAITEQLVFVLIPCASAGQYLQLQPGLDQDPEYQLSGQDYLNAPFDNPVYARLETVLMRAFTGLPTIHKPALKSRPADRVYELRSYEGASEKLSQNKVDQFNTGEIAIFRRLNFNTVFCGQVLAGSRMPNLMYLSAFENQADQEAHWQTFKDDAAWQQLSGLSEYAHNMLRMDKYMLHPTAYSEI